MPGVRSQRRGRACCADTRPADAALPGSKVSSADLAEDKPLMYLPTPYMGALRHRTAAPGFVFRVLQTPDE